MISIGKLVGLLFFAAIVAGLTEPAAAQAPSTPRAQDFQAIGSFDLVVTKSSALKPGTIHVNTVSAVAERMHEVRISPDAIEVTFGSKPIGAGDVAEIVKNGGKPLMTGSYAVLVLMLDKTQHLTQVNLTISVPGTTVTRTVAYMAADVAKAFPDFRFDGTRVKFKTAGSYREAQDETLSMSWSAAIDLALTLK